MTDDEHGLTRVLPQNDVRNLVRVLSIGVRDDLRRDPESNGQRLNRGSGADELSGDDRLNTGFPSRSNKR
jgi:hypothetical protein